MSDWECVQAGLELGCGNGSIAKALAKRVAPAGHVVASDIDLSYIVDPQVPCLELRRIDILQDVIEEGFYDFVVARALLHHLTPARKALERMVSALKPGDTLLSVEPDMLPCTVVEPDSMHMFWVGWLKWSVEAGIDYFVGRKIPAWLDSLRLENVAGEGHTAQFNGGSDCATYWIETVRELTPSLLNRVMLPRKCSKSSMRVIRTRIIGPASSPSQRIGDASRREPRLAMGRGLIEMWPSVPVRLTV